ncbi:MAG: NAD(P)/FAD-dependent oxidoreductase [Lunatimonas sp.]|uniref:phytoene desaturase family protein n=1 Tax=Lunatimonas sp. TaxID=2060141 RepID=UPI00263A97A2|nr:NAD(P)/FAD-dependent oxidoreductase [Lunatimonas sp.]MCC5937155.1 NAD(P)/FAD-dependent oxidoreductase [Lunatimonas sp.]
MGKHAYDAVVVGSGPNGLAAAIVLQSKGLQVLLVEGKDTIGGGMRTMELTLPGFHHDVCSAIHPMAVAAPFFKTLPLQKFGLEFLHPEVLAAHPFPEGADAAVLLHSLEQTADRLGRDKQRYLSLIGPIRDKWAELSGDFLGPLRFPKNPLALASFGLKALQPANFLSKTFREESTRALWAGMAAHGIQPLTNLATSAIALVLLTAGHHGGWPVAKRGSQSLANALGAYFQSLGGEIRTGHMIHSIDELPPARAVLFDVSPRQLLQIAGDRFSNTYKWQLGRYKYGVGVYKMDFALDGPIPWKAGDARLAGTVHLGGSLEEIAHSESIIWHGRYTDNPYVLVAQQSLVDDTRAPKGKHTAWAYCHVPAGSTRDMSAIIENQIEKYAPGFKDLVLGRHSMNSEDLELYNPNYVGGDINAGVQDITQIFTRPALRVSPYRTSAKGIYICSSSTPPGGGVHGMCGYHAARQVIKDLF